MMASSGRSRPCCCASQRLKPGPAWSQTLIQHSGHPRALMRSTPCASPRHAGRLRTVTGISFDCSPSRPITMPPMAGHELQHWCSSDPPGITFRPGRMQASVLCQRRVRATDHNRRLHLALRYFLLWSVLHGSEDSERSRGYVRRRGAGSHPLPDY